MIFQQTTTSIRSFDKTALIGGTVGAILAYAGLQRVKQKGGRYSGLMTTGAIFGGVLIGAGAALMFTKKQDKFYSLDGRRPSKDVNKPTSFYIKIAT